MAISDYVTPDALKEMLESKFGFVEDLSNKDQTVHVMLFNNERVEIPSSINEYKDTYIIAALKKVVEMFPEMEDPAYVLFCIMSVMRTFVADLKDGLSQDGIELTEATNGIALQSLLSAIDMIVGIGYKLD